MPDVLGVVMVTYNAADVIADSLETLLSAAQADGTTLRVAVVDNASTDATRTVLADWASGRVAYVAPGDLPFAHVAVVKPVAPDALTVIAADRNGGFAAGVNIGLALLFADPGMARVWVLNPDSVVPPGTPAAFAQHDPGPFSLMGGRVTYYHRPDTIQNDGGTLNRWTGVTGNLNLFRPITETPAPQASALDFVTGASMVVSRAHYDCAGPMPEDYFLYYEEVDWALCRGDLPLALCPGARVYHHAGTAIGSPTLGRPASAFSLYFKHRARMRFVRRHLPGSVATAWAYTLVKALQYRLKGWHAEGRAVIDGARGRAPPQAVADRLGPVATRLVSEEPGFSARPVQA